MRPLVHHAVTHFHGASYSPLAYPPCQMRSTRRLAWRDAPTVDAPHLRNDDVDCRVRCVCSSFNDDPTELPYA